MNAYPWLGRILELDARLTSRLRIAEQPGALRSLAAVLARSGDSWFWLVGLGLVWLVKPDGWRERAGVMIAGILVTAALIMAIKFTVRRRRPEGEWGGIYRNTDPHSFPSGHAARVVMLAMLALSLGPAWFAALLVVWAPLVGLARIAMGVHYVSDVVAGMVFGGVMGVAINMIMN
jgi:undecaprenyl-diphosphatase